MKKITFLVLFAAMVTFTVNVNAALTDPLMVSDFDATNFNPTFWYASSPQLCTIATIVDPDNASNHILQFNRTATASTWHGPQWGNSVMSAGVAIGSNSALQYRYLVVKAKKSTTYKISAALQTGVSGAPNITFETSNTYTSGSWVTYVFDMGSANGTYKLLYLMPENGGTASAATTYFDEIYFTNNVSSLVTSSAITSYTAWTPAAYGRGGNSISLFWQSLTTATSYNVYNGSTLLASGITTPYTTLTGLNANTSYNIQITGVNQSGESNKSTALAVTTRSKVGVNYEIIDEMEGTNPGWAVMSNGIFTYGTTNPTQSGQNTSAKAIKVAFATNTNNYAGAQITTERIVAGASANFRYLHVKMLRPTSAPATSSVKLKLTNGSVTLGQTSLTEQEIPLVTGTVVKNDATWQDYVFDLKGSGVNDQIYKGFFFMPLFTTTGTVGVTADCYIDDVFLSNDVTPYTSNITSSTVNLSANNLSMGSVSSSGSYLNGVNTNFTATSSTGYHFINWTENGTEISTNATYSFTVSSGKTLVANFEPNTIALSSGTTNASTINCTTCDVTVASGAELTVGADKTLKSVTVAAGGKLTITAGILSATNGITLESNETSTATLLDSYSDPTINANVKQYVTAGRNWYMSAPVTTAPYTWLNRGTSVQEWNEVSKAWIPVSSNLIPGKGYIQVATSTPVVTGTTGTVDVNGTTNSGNIAVNITRTESGSGRGFNLVGNPYPSYLKWSGLTNSVLADAGNNGISTSFWYRTKNTSDAYVFTTWNGTANLVVGGTNVSGTLNEYIPPMQAFWVRVNENAERTTHSTTLTFKNNMRLHGAGDNNIFKAPGNDERSRLRLQLTNGFNTDETLIYVDANAKNSFDNFDSPKFMNNSTAVPDIYSKVADEKVAINGLMELHDNMELALGVRTGTTGYFTVKVNELTNFDNNTRIFLRDTYAENTEVELTAGTEYVFESTTTSTNENRFSLLIKAPGATTGNVNAESNQVSVFVNAQSEIVINAVAGSRYSVYNTAGQQIAAGKTVSAFETINQQLNNGVYVVKVGSVSKRVIVK